MLIQTPMSPTDKSIPRPVVNFRVYGIAKTRSPSDFIIREGPIIDDEQLSVVVAAILALGTVGVITVLSYWAP